MTQKATLLLGPITHSKLPRLSLSLPPIFSLGSAALAVVAGASTAATATAAAVLARVRATRIVLEVRVGCRGLGSAGSGRAAGATTTAGATCGSRGTAGSSRRSRRGLGRLSLLDVFVVVFNDKRSKSVVGHGGGGGRAEREARG